MTTKRLLGWLVVAFFAAFPYLPFVPYSLLGNANKAAQFALIAVSIVVLTGWVGQISLGHAGLVGTGAYVTGLAAGGLNIGFPVSLLWGAVAGMLIASLLGVVALRVRGLYLAVATLIFSWVAEAFLFRQDWFTRHSSIQVQPLGRPNTIPYFDWTTREVYYYAAWATVAVAILFMSNLRDSKSGRSFFAVRGSEVAAASLGIDVMRTKLVAFAVSGFLAGAAGALIMIGQQTVTPDAFKVDQSLFFLSIAVVGGLSSLGGSVAAAVVFALLEQLFFQVKVFEGYLTVVSAVLLAVVLLAYRGGLAAVPAGLAPRLRPLTSRMTPVVALLDERLLAITGWIKAWGHSLAGHAPEQWRHLLVRTGRFPSLARSADTATDPGGESTGGAVTPRGTTLFGDRAPGQAVDPARREDRPVLLAAESVTVRFGGLAANQDVSLAVHEGEIVGLIGPNGAGKTTCFNAIAGLNVPAEGRIEMFGRDVTNLAVHERARLGVGRTFQAIQLFGQLSVFENLLVATHQHNETGILAHLVVTPRSLLAERAARAKVREVIELLGLGDVADRPVRDLPFGVLRMVEVARALVTGAQLIMLDEPASGLDNNETDKLIELIRFIRSLGITILLIEHDVRMVTAVCDYIYVLELGRLLAEGPATTVTRDERVIAAYLGQAVGEKEPAASAEPDVDGAAEPAEALV